MKIGTFLPKLCLKNKSGLVFFWDTV